MLKSAPLKFRVFVLLPVFSVLSRIFISTMLLSLYPRLPFVVVVLSKPSLFVSNKSSNVLLLVSMFSICQEAVLNAFQEPDVRLVHQFFSPTNVWVIEATHEDQVLLAQDFLEQPK